MNPPFDVIFIKQLLVAKYTPEMCFQTAATAYELINNSGKKV